MATILKPDCNLADAGDNITKIVLKVTAALDGAGQKHEGTAFWETAMKLRSAAAVVELARAYVGSRHESPQAHARRSRAALPLRPAT